MDFSDYFIQGRLPEDEFLSNVKKLLDWQLIDNEISNYYSKGTSVDGRPAYRGILLFRMLLLETFYGMSDVQVEQFVRFDIRAMHFCDLGLDDSVPDHSTISRFRSALVKEDAFNNLLSHINDQLSERGMFVRKGCAMVDASITQSPRKPKKQATYELAEDRHEDERDDAQIQKEDQEMKLTKIESPGVDTEGRWLSKGKPHRKKHYFGYKRHALTNEDGLIDYMVTTPANVNDHKAIGELLSYYPQDESKDTIYQGGLYGDKGYRVKAVETFLKEKGVKSRIQYKAARSHPLSAWQQVFNKLVSKKRFAVERTFGSIKKWFKTGICRYMGLEKTHAQHVMEAIAYNLKRAPRIIVP